MKYDETTGLYHIEQLSDFDGWEPFAIITRPNDMYEVYLQHNKQYTRVMCSKELLPEFPKVTVKDA